MSLIRLDLTALLASGQITPEDAARLSALALPSPRGHLAVNLLLIFGALAVAAGAIALVPDAGTGLLLALGALAGAEVLRRQMTGESFALLAAALALMGTLGLAGWVGWQFQDAPATAPALLITLILTAGALWYRSAFLAALAVLALGAVFGSGTGYWHASYALFVGEPLITLAVFGALAGGIYRLRASLGAKLAASWQTLATVAARTSLILVHFAFWVGSLWGDAVGDSWLAYDGRPEAAFVPAMVFSVAWAALSLALTLATPRGGFLSVSGAVFLAIHGYTQYFETFGAEPVSLLIAGLLLVALAIGVSRLIGRRAPAELSSDG